MLIDETNHSRYRPRSNYVVTLLLIAPFLPYLPYGLKAEHLLSIVFAFAALIYITASKSELRPALIAVGILAAAVVPSVISSSVFETAGTEAGIVNMFVRILLPPLLLLSFVFVIETEDIKLTHLINAITVASAIVGGISILSTIPAAEHLFYPFVVEAGVWGASREVGRHPGIFNQPLEAGLFFGMAAIVFVYKFGDKKKNIALLSLALTLSLIGGSVSLSKTFILGVTLAVIYAFFTRRWLSVLVLGSSVIWVGVSSMLLNPSGSYFNSLLALLKTGGPIAAVSAGRFGIEEAGNSEMTVELANADWGNFLLGFGLGSKMPLDSGFLEYAYQGGFLALIGYLAFFAFFIWISFRHLRGDARLLSIFLLSFSLLASIGGPTITANRAGYVLILLLAGLLVAACRSSRGQIEEPLAV